MARRRRAKPEWSYSPKDYHLLSVLVAWVDDSELIVRSKVNVHLMLAPLVGRGWMNIKAGPQYASYSLTRLGLRELELWRNLSS